MRATYGTCLAIVFASVYNQASPFVSVSVNVLSSVCQNYILVLFFAALIIVSKPFEYQDGRFGWVLCLLFCAVAVVAFGTQYLYGSTHHEVAQKLREHASHLKEMWRRVDEAMNQAHEKFDAVWQSLSRHGGEELLQTARSMNERFDARPRQPVGVVDSDTLIASATAAAPTFFRSLHALIVVECGGVLQLPPPGGEFSGDDRPFDLGPDALKQTLKRPERIAEKVSADYGGDFACVCDVVRCSARFEWPAEVDSALQRLEASRGALRLVRVKERLSQPVHGYRDVLLNLAVHDLETDELLHVGELQLHLTEILELKEIAHVSYGIARGLTKGGGTTGGGPSEKQIEQRHERIRNSIRRT